MPDGSERSTPVAGPLSVTPLYTSSGDDVVWWDGTSWHHAAISGGPGPGGGTVNSGLTNQLAFYPSPGGTAVSGNAHISELGGQLNVNYNAAPATIPGMAGLAELRLTNADGASPTYLAVGYGTPGIVTLAQSGGTGAAPAALTGVAPSGQLGTVAFAGWDGIGTTMTPSAVLTAFSTQAGGFASGQHGTRAEIRTTPTGTATLTPMIGFEANGAVLVPPGAPTNLANMGPGTINATGLFINGAAVGTASATVNPGTGPQLAQYPAGTSSVVAGVPITGDITIAQGGVTAIGAGRVSYAKMQAMTANRLLGSGLSGTAVAEVVLGPGLSFTGTTLNVAAAAGNVTATALTTNALVIGTGPLAIGSLATGSATTVLHGNAGGGQPAFSQVNLALDVTGNLPVGNLGGGTAGAGASATTFWRGDGTWQVPSGVGGLTSVGLTAPAGSLFGVTGSPLIANGSMALTTTGTSGGIPYFNTANTLNSTPVLAAHGVMLGQGAGNAPTALAPGTSGYILQSTGAASDPVWASVALGTGTVSTGVLNALGWYSAATAVIAPNAHAFETGSQLALNYNASANALTAPTMTGPTHVRLTAPDTTSPQFLALGFGSGGLFVAAAAGGTGASPLATPSGAQLGNVGFAGYEGSGTMIQCAATSAIAAETFSAGHHGNRIVISTTPIASTTLTAGLGVEANGGITVPPVSITGTGGVTGGGLGPGTVNAATGYYVGGTGSLQLFSGGTFTALYGPDGGSGAAGLFLGSVGNANFYRQNAHTFQDRTGATSFAALTATGLVVGSPPAAATPTAGDINCQRLLINGAVPATGADTTTGGITGAVGAQGAGALTTTGNSFNVFTTVAAGTVTTLPAGVAGTHCIIRNSGANPLLVYPALNGFINSQAINTAITVSSNSTAYFEAQDTVTHWFTVP